MKASNAGSFQTIKAVERAQEHPGGERRITAVAIPVALRSTASVADSARTDPDRQVDVATIDH